MTEPARNHIGIRLATPDDAEGIRRVYLPFIDTPVTFEEEEPAPDAFHRTMEEILAFYPGLVAYRTDGAAGDPGEPERIIGYAYAHRQAERAAYDWNAELSIYLAPDARHTGIGSALYEALLALLPLQGIRCAYARVTLPNAGSERLHARFGFSTMGVQRNAGFKSSAWRDVAWYTLPVGAFDAKPERPVPFPLALRAHAREAEDILSRANDRLRA